MTYDEIVFLTVIAHYTDLDNCPTIFLEKALEIIEKELKIILDK